MLGLKKSEKKISSKLNTNILLILEVSIFSFINHKKLRIRFNPNPSSNKKLNELDNTLVDFNSEIAKKIDNILEENGKKDIIFSADSIFKKELEQPMQNIVEFRLPIIKQPEMPHSSDEEKTTFKEFYEAKFPAEYYYRFKDPKDASSTKIKTSDDSEKQEKTTGSTKAVPHIKIKKENVLIDEELKKKHNGLSKKEEELKKQKEKLEREKELLKKQEQELKKEAKLKLKQKKLEEKQRKIQEKQKIKEEKQKEKEEKIKELLLLKKIEQEKKKKKKEDDTSVTQTRTIEDKTDETVKDFDKLVLTKKESGREKIFFDEDVEKIIPVIDSLLEKLPENVIEDFAQSDDFALYEKVVNKYKKK